MFKMLDALEAFEPLLRPDDLETQLCFVRDKF